MTKRIFIFLTIIAAAFMGQAQVVKGVVKENDHEPMMYASVTLTEEGKTLAGAVTDSAGSFALKLKKGGTFTLKISSVGYSPFTQEVTVGDRQTTDLGHIVMPHSSITLDEVTIEGEAAEKNVTLERIRFRTSGSIAAATGSLLEVIRSSPTVSVDADGNVAIRGNRNVLILVDGVPTTLDGLGAMSAADVQSLDILTSPDVKYDSEGTGGIISIVSKQQKEAGVHAMLSANYGYRGFANGSAALSYNKGKWGVRANYSGTYAKDQVESELQRHILQTGSTIDQLIGSTQRNMNHNLGLNVSYRPTKKDQITLNVKAGLPMKNNVQDFKNHYRTDSTESSKQRQTDITFNRIMIEGGIAYKHQFVPNRQELSLAASVSSIKGDRPSYYYEEGTMVQRSVSGGHPLIVTGGADYMAMLGKTRLETGLKMTYRQNNIDHKMYELSGGEWTLSAPLSSDLRHREYIPAAYAMVGAKLANGLSYKAGVRFEYSHTTLHSDRSATDEQSDAYFVAPNVVLNYKVSDAFNLAFSLSRRISRPTYPQLNPYINLIDNQTYEQGNMRLRPEKSNKADAGYTYNSKVLGLNGILYLAYTQDYISQITYLAPAALVMTYINADSDLKTGLEQHVRVTPLRWMEIEIATNTFYTRSAGSFEGADFCNRGWVNNSNATLNFKPLKGMSIQAQYFVTSPQYFPQFTTKTIHYCNLGVKQSLLEGSLVLSALVTDLFNTRRWDISADNTVYTLANMSKNRSRVFWIGATWNFNSFKPMDNKKKQEEDRSIIRLGE